MNAFPKLEWETELIVCDNNSTDGTAALARAAGAIVAGSFIFCETAAFLKVGGFSFEWFASEEIDLSRRLKQLAREMGRQIVILHRHPMATSARKMHLYTPREHIRFLVKTLFHWR